MSMLLRTALVAVAGLTANALLSAEPAEKPNLEGQHAIVAGERDGKPLDESEFKGATFRFTDRNVVGADKNDTEFLTAEYNLNADRTPCEINMKLTAGSDKGQERLGLIERKGDTIRIIYAGRDGERPTEFKTRENQTMYTLRVDLPAGRQ